MQNFQINIPKQQSPNKKVSKVEHSSPFTLIEREELVASNMYDENDKALPYEKQCRSVKRALYAYTAEHGPSGDTLLKHMSEHDRGICIDAVMQVKECFSQAIEERLALPIARKSEALSIAQMAELSVTLLEKSPKFSDTFKYVKDRETWVKAFEQSYREHPDLVEKCFSR